MARLAWTVQVGAADRAALSFGLQVGGEPTHTTKLERPILPAVAHTPVTSGVGLLREYLDPLNDRPLDLAHLRAGQLVRVRLTIVNTELRPSIAIDEPLPGGCMLIEAGSADFAQIEQDIGSLSLSSVELAPGIYQYHYLLRAVAAGHYGVAATAARRPGGELIGVGKPTILFVER
jgi:uncharacterized protein YfaS (alpha-2-macroglobulin family)